MVGKIATTVLAGCIMIGVALPLNAADDEALTLARRVVEANGIADSFDRLESGMISPLVAKIKDPEQAARTRSSLQEPLGKVRSEMIADASRYIAEHMSKDEMSQTIQFFESSAGRKLNSVVHDDELGKIAAGHFSKVMMLVAMAGGAPR
jgi:hypothetical protein